MAISLLSNTSALRAQNNLKKTGDSLTRAFERLSSGQRIIRGADDAAGLAISSQLDVNSRIYGQGVRNINDGISFLNVAESALSSLNQIVLRQTELAEQAANGALSSSQRASLDLENQSLADEYERILTSSEFNGVNLIVGDSGEISIQGGPSNLNVDYLTRLSTPSAAGLGTYTETSFGLTGHDIAKAGLLVHDLNGDGIDDIIAVQVGGTSGEAELMIEVSVFLGNSSGSYSLNSNSVSTESITKLNSVDEIQAEFSTVTNSVEMQIAFTDSSMAAEILKSAKIDDGGNITSFSDDSAFSINKLSESISGDFNGDNVADIANVPSPYDLAILTQDTVLSDFEDLSLVGTSLLTESSALQALDDLKDQLDIIARAQGNVGSAMSRFNTADSVARNQELELGQASSRIRDLDVASEVANMARLQVLQDGAVAVLAQANQQFSIALNFLSPEV